MTHRMGVLLLLFVSHCAHGRDGDATTPPASTPLSHGSMERHFEEAGQLRMAALRGEVDTVREVARQFDGRVAEATYPDPWGPSVERLEAVLHAAGDVSTLNQSSQVVGRVGAACGRCHLDNEVPVRIDWPLEPDPEHRMDTFAYATELLWLGLIVPSDEAWARGASAYHAAMTCEEFESVRLGPYHVSSCSSAKATGGVVLEAATVEQRERAFGDVVSTCAGCHAQPS